MHECKGDKGGYMGRFRLLHIIQEEEERNAKLNYYLKMFFFKFAKQLNTEQSIAKI